MIGAKESIRKNVFTIERILKGELRYFFAIVTLKVFQSIVYLLSVYYLILLKEDLRKGNAHQIIFSLAMFFCF
ncbi:hypothetical protein X924_03110 [Petrotoga sp. 9PWA.NaAc.5.4]|nr:hypothetical protein X924_03110 [Petrotoga sp. 9PWA.NaAc.5.4]